MHTERKKMDDATVYVVDDDAAFRASLGWFLESLGKTFELCSSAEQFLEIYDPDRVGCLVLDFRLPGMSGIALLETLRERESCLPAIVLTAHAETTLAVRALKLGAFDFLEKPFDHTFTDRICTAIAAHERALHAQRLITSSQQKLATLTKREREVMSMVVQGEANKVIAYELGLSEKTIEVHRARVMQKLKVASLAELVRFDLTATCTPWAYRPMAAQEAHRFGTAAFAA